MAENANTNPYGYQDDEQVVNPFVFGLNAGVTFLKKFEFTPTGGAGGKEQEALDIIFEINGKDKSYRMFPVTKAYGKNNEEITDPSAPEFKKAQSDFNAKVTHILHCFIAKDQVIAGMSTPQLINASPKEQFKVYCQIAAALLPKNFATKPLDIFLQYQAQISNGQNRTFLEIPKKMAYGKWLCPAQPGTWMEERAKNFDDKTVNGIRYGKLETAEKDADGKVIKFTEYHPFVKNGWFLNSKFIHQQTDGSSAPVNNAAANAAIAGNAPVEGAAPVATRTDMW